MIPPLISVWKDGRQFAMTPATLLEELTYATYRRAREDAPTIPLDHWRTIFHGLEALEARFQAESMTEHGHA